MRSRVEAFLGGEALPGARRGGPIKIDGPRLIQAAFIRYQRLLPHGDHSKTKPCILEMVFARVKRKTEILLNAFRFSDVVDGRSSTALPGRSETKMTSRLHWKSSERAARWYV